MPFGSQVLAETPGSPMGVVQSTGVAPATPGDTLPYTLAGAVPTATGAGWASQLTPITNPVSLGTLTGSGATTTLNWAANNFFIFTAPASAFTLAFSNVTVGQTITIIATGVASGVPTWPTVSPWIGVIATPAVSASAPALASAAVWWITITCTAAGVYAGTYIVN